jgi:hypothetical protein
MNARESVRNNRPISMEINYKLCKFEYMKMIKERRKEFFDEIIQGWLEKGEPSS